MKNLFLILTFVLFCACGSSSPKSEAIYGANETGTMASEQDFTAAKDATEPIKTDVTDNVEKKIIKTGNVSMQVDDYTEAKVTIDTLVARYKGYVSSENETNYGYRRSNSIAIRVPQSSFDVLLNELIKEAKFVDSKTISVADVTEEYMDVVSRLENKKQVLQQYRNLLKDAKNVGDILAIQEHLRIIQEEIDVQQGRLKFLDSQVSFSTINLTVYQNNDTSYQPSFLDKIFEGFAGGWDGILNFIIGITYLWPLLIVVGVLIWWIINRRRKNKQQQPQQ